MPILMDSTLPGSLAFITGGGRGVGRLFALRLASEGVTVVLIARSRTELKSAAREISECGGRVFTFVVDVTNRRAVRRVVERVERTIGPIDVLINNAGIVGPVGNTWECRWKHWWSTIQINVGGTAVVSEAVIPKMVGRGHGRIVNMVSHAGAYRWPTVSAYSVSKAALIRFSENLALECSRFGLQVFAYHPGLLPLGMTNAAAALHGSSVAAEAKIGAWCRAQMASDKAASPERAATQLVKLLSGSYDELTGRYITESDDLDALVIRARDVDAYNDYLMLRPQV
ncbi:SDR family oxidoreductase [Luteibacter sp.]|uniref:SDR family NAD(P)-dependent oxidoreductase n=1 Tax=Luteibacter sp. TaxID=1886636 RepID=UPI002D7F48C6|nr:SDR family oxidoreductase [Luteibacter sp.]